MEERIILVDAQDNEIGSGEKMKVHQEGKLHRAFSIFIFNKKGEMLLQRRADEKYHSPGLWTNTCCSHPRVGESIMDAANRRLKEEMGFDCNLKEILNFHYKFVFSNGLIENEIDHVLTGIYNKNPKINKSEVSEFKWIKMDEVKRDIEKNPGKYTEWFKIVLEKYSENLN